MQPDPPASLATPAPSDHPARQVLVAMRVHKVFLALQASVASPETLDPLAPPVVPAAPASPAHWAVLAPQDRLVSLATSAPEARRAAQEPQDNLASLDPTALLAHQADPVRLASQGPLEDLAHQALDSPVGHGYIDLKLSFTLHALHGNLAALFPFNL